MVRTYHGRPQPVRAIQYDGSNIEEVARFVRECGAAALLGQYSCGGVTLHAENGIVVPIDAYAVVYGDGSFVWTDPGFFDYWFELASEAL